MRNLLYTIIILSALVLSTLNSYSQCQDFNEVACKERLKPYTNYGNYISTTLTDGEYAELNMTFYSNQEYRLAVCGLENVAQLEFRVFDSEHNLLFKNKDDNFSRIWDFKLESSQQLIIAIIVPETDTPTSGCVAILNGMKMN
jgi:hypothetical protein